MPDTWDGDDRARDEDQGQGADVAGIAYNIHDWPDDWLFRSMILQGGGQMLDNSETASGFGGPVGLKVMRNLRRFVTECDMPLIDWDQSRQQFIAGKIGIFADTPARLRQVTDSIGDKFTLRTSVFPIDDKAKAACQPVAMRRSSPPGRRQAEAAWEFLKFVSGPEAQKIVVETTGYMPTNLRASGAGVPREVLRPEPELPHRVAEASRGSRGKAIRRQLGAHLAHAARHHQCRDARNRNTRKQGSSASSGKATP